MGKSNVKSLGKLCRNGHEFESTGQSLRNTSGQCVECNRLRSASFRNRHGDEHKEKQKKYYWNNVERLRQQAIDYRNEHIETYRTRSREYARVHPEANKERARLWRESNPERAKSLCARHYKLKTATPEGRERWNAQGKAWYTQNRERGRVLRRVVEARRRARKENLINDLTADQAQALLNIGCCVYCGKTSKKLHLDHVVPVAKGGHTTVSNMVPACYSCNCSKSDRLVSDWYPAQTFFNADVLQWLQGRLAA